MKTLKDLEKEMITDDTSEIEKYVNPFLKKWCGNNYPHLVDTDENDGQILRYKILDEIYKAKQDLLKEVKEIITNEINKFKAQVHLISLHQEEIDYYDIQEEIFKLKSQLGLSEENNG